MGKPKAKSNKTFNAFKVTQIKPKNKAKKEKAVSRNIKKVEILPNPCSKKLFQLRTIERCMAITFSKMK